MSQNGGVHKSGLALGKSRIWESDTLGRSLSRETVKLKQNWQVAGSPLVTDNEEGLAGEDVHRE